MKEIDDGLFNIILEFINGVRACPNCASCKRLAGHMLDGVKHLESLPPKNDEEKEEEKEK